MRTRRSGGRGINEADRRRPAVLIAAVLAVVPMIGLAGCGSESVQVGNTPPTATRTGSTKPTSAPTVAPKPQPQQVSSWSGSSGNGQAVSGSLLTTFSTRGFRVYRDDGSVVAAGPVPDGGTELIATSFATETDACAIWRAGDEVSVGISADGGASWKATAFVGADTRDGTPRGWVFMHDMLCDAELAKPGHDNAPGVWMRSDSAGSWRAASSTQSGPFASSPDGTVLTPYPAAMNLMVTRDGTQWTTLNPSTADTYYTFGDPVVSDDGFSVSATEMRPGDVDNDYTAGAFTITIADGVPTFEPVKLSSHVAAPRSAIAPAGVVSVAPDGAEWVGADLAPLLGDAADHPITVVDLRAMDHATVVTGFEGTECTDCRVVTWLIPQEGGQVLPLEPIG